MKNKRYTYGVAQRVSPKGKRQNVYEKNQGLGDTLYMSPKGYVYVAQGLLCICRLKLNVCMSPKV